MRVIGTLSREELEEAIKMYLLEVKGINNVEDIRFHPDPKIIWGDNTYGATAGYVTEKI